MSEIDVSKCQYYVGDDTCDSVGTVTLHCSKNNCYYKQLQKFKQENEELKERLAIQKVEFEEELDVLKEEIRQLHNGRTPVELYSLFGKPIRYWENIEQKLEKIKEIIYNNEIDYDETYYEIKEIFESEE